MSGAGAPSAGSAVAASAPAAAAGGVAPDDRFWQAATAGDVAYILAAAQKPGGQGVNVDALDQHGQTALHYAVANGNVPLALTLLQTLRANPNVRQNLSPLHYSAAYNQPELCRLLLQFAADPSVRDNEGRSPLDWAERRKSTEVKNLLFYCTPHATPLHKAARAGDDRACYEMLQPHAASYGQPGGATYLPPNHPDEEGNTPLHLAASTGNAALVDLLLKWGGNPHLRNRAGQVPLDIARIATPGNPTEGILYAAMGAFPPPAGPADLCKGLLRPPPYAGPAAAQLVASSPPQGRAALAQGAAPATQAETCWLPECHNPCVSPHHFCSREHGRQGKLRGLCMYPKCPRPRAMSQVTPSEPVSHLLDFCSKKHADDALTIPHPVIRVLDPGEMKFDDVKKQFLAKWTKVEYGDPATLKIESIAQVQMNGAVTSAYLAYRDSLIRRGDIKAYGHGGPGNEQRRFHGTNMKCKLGTDSQHEDLCNMTGCALCSILRGGFQLKFFGSGKSSWGRFGRGHYFTSTSSKTHDYNVRSTEGLGPGRRLTLVCQVMIGKGKRMEEDADTLTEPPTGFDSVLGEVGTRLNFDELCVYRDDACIPKFLVVYSGGVGP